MFGYIAENSAVTQTTATATTQVLQLIPVTLNGS